MMLYLELIIALLALSVSAYEYTYSFPSWNGNYIANTLDSDDPKVVNKVREIYSYSQTSDGNEFTNSRMQKSNSLVFLQCRKML